MTLKKRTQCIHILLHDNKQGYENLQIRQSYTSGRAQCDNNKQMSTTQSCLGTLLQPPVKPLQPTHVYGRTNPHLHLLGIIIQLRYVLLGLTNKKNVI